MRWLGELFPNFDIWLVAIVAPVAAMFLMLAWDSWRAGGGR